MLWYTGALAGTSRGTTPLHTSYSDDDAVTEVTEAPREALAVRIACSPWWMSLVIFVVCLPIVVYAVLPLGLVAELALTLAMMGAGMLILVLAPQWRLAAAFVSLAASSRYLWWRATETLYLDSLSDATLSVALLGAELYGFTIMVGGYFQTAVMKERTPIPLDVPEHELPSVDVFIPTYNEDTDIVRRTIIGALSIDYPGVRVRTLEDGTTEEFPLKEVYVLDDGRRPEMQELCEELGCRYITRPDNKGAKAGNINHAMMVSDGELIAIFDADHVPVRSFLQTTVGFFLDNENTALVQTPHHFYNPDPFERNLYLEHQVPPEQALFYHLIQKGNDFWNSAFFCGSCAVLRREALEEVGGIAQETVTEDAHTALKMHARGWQSVYLDLPQAAGLATERFAFHVGQRIRWARGMTQILRLDFPLLKRGLRLPQRINYTIAACHFLFGIPRIVYLLAPPLYLILDFHPLQCTVRDILVMAIPHLFLSTAVSAAGNRNTRHSFWPEVFETSIAWYTAVVTTVAMISPRHGTFNVTPKGGELDEAEFDWRSARPMIVFMVLAILSLLFVPYRLLMAPYEWDSIAIAGVWNFYNIVILAAAMGAAYERPQRRAHNRVEAYGRVRVRKQGHAAMNGSSASTAVAAGEFIEGELEDLSEGGARIRLPVALPETREVHVTIETRTGAVIRAQAIPVFQALEEEDDEHLLLLEDEHENGENGSDLPRRFDPDAPWYAVGLEFVRLDPEDRRRIIELMFTPPDQWVHDRYVQDRPATSIWTVVRAPFVAFVGRYFGADDVGIPEDAGQPLTRFRRVGYCYLCDGEHLAVFGQCPIHRVPLQIDEGTELWMSDREPRGRLTGSMVAAGLLMLAFLMAVGWGPTQLWVQDLMRPTIIDPATVTRISELEAAHHELERLHIQARVSLLPLAPSLKADWGKRLWTVQHSAKLPLEPSSETGGNRSSLVTQAEEQLRRSYNSLSRAGVLLQKDDMEAPAQDLMDEARSSLSLAEDLLDSARRD